MIGLSDILSALQNGVRAINELNTSVAGLNLTSVVSSVSPSSTPAFTSFLSSQSQGFISVRTSSGGVYFIPVY